VIPRSILTGEPDDGSEHSKEFKQGAVQVVVSIFEVDVEKLEIVTGNTGGFVDTNAEYRFGKGVGYGD
jgi:hypothetical protein